MVGIQHILCPIDFSDFSRRALDHAVAFATWYRATVSALDVHRLSARAFLLQILFYGSLITGSTLVAYLWALAHWLPHATTISFMTLALAQILHVGNARSGGPYCLPPQRSRIRSRSAP